MNKRVMFGALLTLLIFGVAAVTIRSASEAQALLSQPLSTQVSVDSSLSVLFPPSSAISSQFNEVQIALAYLAKRENVLAENLRIVNDFRRESLILGRMFQAVTVLDMKNGHFFQVLVDLESGEVEDKIVIEETEEQWRQARYGKLQPALYERLKAMRSDEWVTVAIWVTAPSGKSLSEQQSTAVATLAIKYPQARESLLRGGKLMDLNDPDLAERIYKEYVQILDAENAARISPLVQALEGLEFTVKTFKGLPAVTVRLPRSAIEKIVGREDVGMLYLSERGQRYLLLDSTTQTNLAPQVWTRGYYGTGTDIAILEAGNVDFTSHSVACPVGSNNCFQSSGAIRWAMSGEIWHTTLVASSAASNHAVYRGMAPGATIMSAGIQGPDRQDDIDALIWALDQGAEVVNASYGWCTQSTQMDGIDRVFDYYARARGKLLVAAAGNNGLVCPFNFVNSPAKGWNVLSVGAYDDHNDSNWANDEIADFSAWENPDSFNGDHEKPEVVAPGISVTGIEMNGNSRTAAGTSFSAPQVAGLAALLIDRNQSLHVWPDANKAIIMASATHNITGPTGIPSGQDLRDGSGGINAALADAVAQTRNLSEMEPCFGSCWWGFHITNDESDFPVDNYLYRRFVANRGDFVRVAITWWSNADCLSESNCSFDRLDTDLHLGVRDPDFE